MSETKPLHRTFPLLKSIVTTFLNDLAESLGEKNSAEVIESMQTFVSGAENKFKRLGYGYESFSVAQQKLFLRLKNYCLPLYANLIPLNSQKIKKMVLLSNFGSKIKNISFIPSSRTFWKLIPLKRNKFDIVISDLFLVVDDHLLLEELITHIDSKIGLRSKSKLPHPFISKSCNSFTMSIERGVLHQKKSGEGSYHDLNAIFNHLNATWFTGKLKSYGLYWTPRTSRKRTGYYKTRSREIFISKNFDSSQVPAFVVEFVMYHEMLHLEQGDDLLHKGTRAHDAEFRRREQLYPQYRQADLFLKKFARG